MLAPLGQLPLKALVLLTSATFADVALIAVLPVASGAGSALTPLVLPASCTRYYWPGASVRLVRFVTDQVVPLALAYCTDQPFSDWLTLLALNNSI